MLINQKHIFLVSVNIMLWKNATNTDYLLWKNIFMSKQILLFMILITLPAPFYSGMLTGCGKKSVHCARNSCGVSNDYNRC